MFRASIVLVTVLLLGAPTDSAFGQNSVMRTLQGTVGPGYTITLKQKARTTRQALASRARTKSR
jgi:hypothetical protein